MSIKGWRAFTKGFTLGLCDTGGCGSSHTHDILKPSNDLRRSREHDKTTLDKLAERLGLDHDQMKGLAILSASALVLLIFVGYVL